MTIDSRHILAVVRANHAKLRGCDGPHHFERQEGFPVRFVCSRCGGWRDAAALAYMEGLLHGMTADPDDPAVLAAKEFTRVPRE